MDDRTLNRAIRKAQKTTCRHKIAAIAYDRKGRVLGISKNSGRFTRKGGGFHAEMVIMRKWGRKIKKIIIIRVNVTGSLLPIHPCDVCASKAKDLGIKIYNLNECC